MSYCLLPDDICTKEESGDRIPDDLTVAPTRVDAMTVLLSCIAMGMQVFKYSTTTHEIARVALAAYLLQYILSWKACCTIVYSQMYLQQG